MYVCLYEAISHAPYVFQRGTVKGWCLVCLFVCVGGVCVHVCECVRVYGMCQTQCLLGVWGGATDWPRWMAFYASKIWLTCTHTQKNGGYDCGLTKTRYSKESEQSIHTSRVTWTIRVGNKEVSLPYACFAEEKEKRPIPPCNPQRILDPTAVSLVWILYGVSMVLMV